MNSNPTEAVFDQFTASLTSVLSQALMSGWQANISVQAPESDCVTARFAAAPPLAGDLLVSMPREDARRLADVFLGNSTGADDEWTSDRQEAFEELLRQIVGNFQTSLKARVGEIAFTFKAEPLANGVAGEKRTYECRRDAGEPLSFTLILTADLATALEKQREVAAPPSVSALKALERDPNLELLMDVELAATLRFGRRRMVMREILELNSGAVVELDRQVQDPVELLIDSKVVARGELVIVDGSYGIRVTQVAAPNQRIGLIS